MPYHISNAYRFTRLGAVSCYMENTAVDGLNFLNRFIAFDAEKSFTGIDEFAILFEPRDECPFFHGPAKTGNNNFDRHILGELSMNHGAPYSAIKSRMARATSATCGVITFSKVGL